MAKKMTLSFYKEKVEMRLMEAIEKMGEKNTLRDACEYALLNGGKRLRPMIVLMVADALKKGIDVMPAALSVEYFHTASLIADDLPCMDNDDLRRGKASLHKAFPESVAVLASYTLIALGYGGISENAERMKEAGFFAEEAGRAAILALEAVTKCAGIQGATHGQFLDLFPQEASFAAFCKIVEMKTSSLFEVAFTFGWLFGGGDAERLEEIKKCARHLGMAFQVADDLEDDEQDGNRPLGANLVNFFGRKEAVCFFEEEIFAFKESLKRLGLWTESFQTLFLTLDRSERLPSRFFGGS